MIKNDETLNYLVTIERLTNGFVDKKWRCDCPKEGCNHQTSWGANHGTWRFNR